MAEQYLTIAEADTIIAAMMLATDARRTAWEALDDDDKNVLLKMATADIDMVAWTGRAVDADQDLMWPRYWLGLDSVIDPTGDTDASVGSVPENIRRGCAIQAAWRAARAQGADATAHIAEATARGVVNQSGGGQAESYDGYTARSAWAQLHIDVQHLTMRYKAREAMLL